MPRFARPSPLRASPSKAGRGPVVSRGSFLAAMAGGGALAAGLVTGSRGRAQTAQTGQELDLSGFRVSFSDEFDSLSVSPWGPRTRWIAHTPWNGDFGDARFADPRPGFPFTTENGVLRIEARKDAEGTWESGLLAANDLKGNGFAQMFGYFEARAKLPSGPGVWPAFWLMGTERQRYATEIDVMEFYGHEPNAFQSYYHVWSMNNVYPARHVPHPQRVDFDLTQDWHRFGVMIDRRTTTFYLDGRSYWSFETPPEFVQPMFPLVNLALGSGFPIADTPNPSHFLVDYVRIYTR